jgi:polyisoprenoid-binding protein YceI
MTTLATPTTIRTGTWSVDPAHSKIGFAVKHMGIATVRGEFNEFEGTLTIGEDIASSEIYGAVKTQSIDTNEPQRDEHLRSADFFDAAQYPEIRLESTTIEQLYGAKLRITGQLTMHGVTNEIVLHAEINGFDVDPMGNERVGLEVTGQLSRSDYGMKFNRALGSGNWLVADEVKLALDISAVKQSS